MNARETTKTVVRLLAASGFGAAANNIIKSYRSSSDIAPLDFYYQAGALAAGFVAGAAASEAIKPAADKTVDDFFDAVENLFTKK